MAGRYPRRRRVAGRYPVKEEGGWQVYTGGGGGGRLASTGEELGGEFCFHPRCALVTRRSGPGPLLVSFRVVGRVGCSVVSV